jgi:anti-anti-sigma factor
MNETFTVTIRRENGNAVLDMTGDINGFAETALNTAYSQAEAEKPEAVVLNFDKVEYINSTGIALIVGLLAKARVAHYPLIAANLTDHYREIFTITRLSDFITIR